MYYQLRILFTPLVVVHTQDPKHVYRMNIYNNAFVGAACIKSRMDIDRFDDCQPWCAYFTVPLDLFLGIVLKSTFARVMMMLCCSHKEFLRTYLFTPLCRAIYNCWECLITSEMPDPLVPVFACRVLLESRSFPRFFKRDIHSYLRPTAAHAKYLAKFVSPRRRSCLPPKFGQPNYEIWFDYNNVPLKWQYPLGVLCDVPSRAHLRAQIITQPSYSWKRTSGHKQCTQPHVCIYVSILHRVQHLFKQSHLPTITRWLGPRI